MRKILHDYRGRGARTAEGIERIVRANWKHGRRCKQVRQEAAAFTHFIRACRETIAKVRGAGDTGGTAA